ncbi:filamentous hemagglutinin outer membrane protein [Tolypothrix tenuis PCC 7101]|uniref:Filamentous hemagglutinin outer membrane protein n=1 Tax=Tolypothrix tenuis PCC 7101 TaxID=231146 RepID=A0A1Z4NAN7_9CYAN|nr:filamentous hemagglutinin outer membrane protein [Tolypothrix tenuis PCC 7101]BAZ78361.1 filamentous hemagglutinin outer membrane protein [Aulosira laxa NIES-50]
MKKLGRGRKVRRSHCSAKKASPTSVLLGCLGALAKLSWGIAQFTVGIAAFISPALAQSNIVPDNTLGSEASRVIFNFNGTPNEVIGGGAQRGQNLFHSFREFNVGENRGAYFFVFDPNIQNILARVTGSNRSDILGILGTRQVIDGDLFRSNANLFLMNPNGIVFGENASLDIGASFYATTANGIQFGNQGNFSATNPQTPEVLTVNPSALFFNQINQNAAIQNNSIAPAGISPSGLNASGLRVPDGKSLLLIGSDIKMDGGRLRAYGGRVELGGLSAVGNINLQLDGNNFSLEFPENITRADVSLKNAANINVSAGNGGSIIVNARNIDILQDSALIAGITQGLGTSETVAGDIILNATGEINVSGLGSGIFNFVNLGAKGNGGNIYINSSSLLLQDSALLAASNLGKGNAGNIVIDAREDVLFDRANASSTVGNQGLGDAGNISIKAGLVSLSNDTYLSASTSGQGNAGTIEINARDSIFFDQQSYAYSLTTTEGVGKSGNVNINTMSLSLKNGSQLSASTFGQGDAGNVTINASDTVRFDGKASAAFSLSGTGAVGKAGGISITTNSLFVTNNAGLDSSASGRGDAGNVNINASNITVFDMGSQVSALVNARGAGKAGTININTGKLSVNNGSQLSVSSFGQGNAGNVTINASDTVNFDGAGSAVFSISGAGAVGKGGGINISTGSLSMTNGAFLTASTLGRGDAGTVSIDARDRVVFDGVGSNGLNSAARSAVLSGAVGNGGEIRINTRSLYVSNDAELTTRTSGKGDGGNVTINARDIAYLDKNARISSFVEATGEGKGGDINITTGSLSVTDDATILTSTLGRGNAGNVFIQAKDSVSFSNGFIFSSVESEGLGKGGEINVTANSLSLVNGAQFVATSRGAFANVEITLAGNPSIDFFDFIRSSINAGNIQINATDNVSISGFNPINGDSSGLFTDTETSGNSGNITINTDVFSILDSGLLDARTYNFGDAGNITVNARIVEVRNGGQLTTTTTRGGNAGKILVNAKDQVIVSDTYINPNNTEAQVPKRFLKDDTNSGFFVRSSGFGVAGDIEVNSPKVTLDKQGRLIAESASGNGGNIKLVIRDLLLMRRGGQISTNAGTEEKGGNGGNVNINSKFIIAIPKENSDIAANAFEGNGGRVQINTQGIFGTEFRSQETNQSDITASSKFGVSGIVTIESPDNSAIQNNLGKLPQTAIDTNALIANSCIARRNQQQNGSFFITGSGGVAVRPGDAPLPSYSTGDVQPIPAESTTLPTQTRPWQIGDRVIEPTGVYELPNGKLVLGKEC